MVKVKKWIESRIKKPEEEYEETKREFEMAMGTPFIIMKVELPEGFDNLRAEFLSLEKNADFQAEVSDLVKKRLLLQEAGADEDT